MSQASDRQETDGQATYGKGLNTAVPFEPPSSNLLSHMMRPAMSANASVLELNARLFHMAAEASREWLDFIGRRLEKDAELTEELRHAKDPQAIMDAYTQFYQRAVQDYHQEFAELMRLSTKAANGAGEVIKEATSSALPSRS
ncbi:MAG: phasin family protein [Pseudomonadota bacterium]